MRLLELINVTFPMNVSEIHYRPSRFISHDRGCSSFSESLSRKLFGKFTSNDSCSKASANTMKTESKSSVHMKAVIGTKLVLNACKKRKYVQHNDTSNISSPSVSTKIADHLPLAEKIPHPPKGTKINKKTQSKNSVRSNMRKSSATNLHSNVNKLRNHTQPEILSKSTTMTYQLSTGNGKEDLVPLTTSKTDDQKMRLTQIGKHQKLTGKLKQVEFKKEINDSNPQSSLDSGIWSIARATDSESDNNKNNYLMCSLKSGNNSRKFELKSAKITKNLRLCRSSSTSTEENYNYTSKPPMQLACSKYEMTLKTRDESESDAFPSFTTATESIQSNSNSLVCKGDISSQNLIFDSKASNVSKLRSLEGQVKNTEPVYNFLSLSSSPHNDGYIDMVIKRNTLGVPVVTEPSPNDHTTVKRELLSISRLANKNDANTYHKMLKRDISNKESSLRTIHKDKIDLNNGDNSTQQSGYSLCYKMSSSFLTSKLTEEKPFSHGIYTKLSSANKYNNTFTGDPTIIGAKCHSKTGELYRTNKSSSNLAQICDTVLDHPGVSEIIGIYPIPPAQIQFFNRPTSRNSTTTKPNISHELEKTLESANLSLSKDHAEDSCEALEAAQLEQKLRSLGCELVSLRTKLPSSLQVAPSGDSQAPMSPTHTSSSGDANHHAPLPGKIVGGTNFPFLGPNSAINGSISIIDGSKKDMDSSNNWKDQNSPSSNYKDKSESLNGSKLFPLRLQEVEDLIHLTGPLTEDAVLKTVQARFMSQQNYTNVGPILLSINPYNDVGNALTLTSTRMAAPSPHLLRVVHEAVRQQSETGYPQAIILSGASGSGKTYTSMLLLRQLFDVAGGGPETDAFKHLAAAFTVLRSLGSAKTTSNSESSRIGHFIEVQVTDGALYRTKIHCYFLDQTRVVKPLPNEKNYHIFYQMLAGLTQEERAKLHLQGHNVRTLRYLSDGDVRQDVSNDAKRFEAWKACLGVLGIQVLDVVRVLASILLLGNVTFIEGQGLEVDIQGGSHELKNVASLLGVSSAILYSGLTTKTHNVRGQLVKSMCDANMSNMTRDSLSKALYCRTVATIVRRANSLKRLGSTSGTTLSSDSNESVHHQVDVASRTASTVGTAGSKASKSMSVLNSAVRHATDGFIGILDMFGFEEPKPAHLEHLCINLCAETMQHFYNTHIFKSSIESCREEGIACEVEVDYVDNVPCIDLISSLRTGLLSILDLECSVRSTPENYIQKLKVQHKGNSRLFETRNNLVRTFGIHHFASRVVYDASNFLDTNKDIISDDLVSVFQKSSCNFGFATHLFGSELKALHSQEPVPRGMSFRISPTSHTDLQNGYEPVSTLTQDFHTRLDNLLRTLVHAKPHFIRCIRANLIEKPVFFDRATVIRQIRALQVLETVNLMAGGFPHRMRFKTFSLRYRLLAPFKRLRRTEDKTIDDCKLILEYFMKRLEDVKSSVVLIQWALGKRHIFLSEGSRQQLEILRIETRHRSAALIQAIWRGWHLRRKWPNLRRNLELRARARTIRPRPQPISGTPPPEVLDRCSQKTIQQTCSRIGLDLERPPPLPPSRPYTITGNHKLGYPQTRMMKMGFPEDGNGEVVLRKGQTVLVVGASPQRGNLLVEYKGHSVHVPYQFMELNPSSQSSVGI